MLFPMVGRLAGILIPSRFYAHIDPTVKRRETCETIVKETTGVATSIKKSLRTIQRIAYMAVEDTIQLMERLYVTEMGQTAFDHLKLTPIYGRLGRLYEP